MYYNSVLENTDNGYIDYIIKDPSFYYEVGLRVLEYKQRFIGVLSCSKTVQNGNIRLSYNVSIYRTFAEHMANASYSMWDEMLYKILSIISKIKDNGFLRAENLEINENRIFINLYDNSVKMICLPLYKLTKAEDYDSIRKGLIGIVVRLAVNLNNDDRNQLIKIINRHFGKNENLDLIVSDDSPEGILNMQKDDDDIDMNVEEFDEDAEIKFGKNFFKGFFKKKDSDKLHLSDSKDLKHMAATKLYLRSLNADRDIEVNKNNFCIGRGGTGIDADFSDNPRISDIHCKLLIEGRRMYIIDYGSEYGTYVNNMRIDANVFTEFHKGDEIAIANLKFAVE